MRRSTSIVLSLFALAGVAAGGAGLAAASTPAPKPTLQILKTHRYGNILIAGSGYMIYGFALDKPNTEMCQTIRECLTVWPPVLAPHTLRLGAGVKRSLVHSIRLKNGKRQLTYNGWPLYLYIADTKPKQTSNINTRGFGAKWPAINSAGNFVPSH